jgi:hypothetical protein
MAMYVAATVALAVAVVWGSGGCCGVYGCSGSGSEGCGVSGGGEVVG